MPVTEFLSSMADKATSAVNAARGSGPQDSSTGSRSSALANIQHQFRTLQMHYSETTAVQRIITTDKGAVIDYDNVARDFKSYSKELYMWGQADDPDIKDVTDRLAYLAWVQGALASSLAGAVEASRLPFKLLRDAEVNLKPRRENRTALQAAITRVESAREKGMEKRLAELRGQLKKAEVEDAPLEKEVELLKRKAIRESEETKWTAVREYGEKLVLLAEASSTILSVLPTLPPSIDSPYDGAQTTANARAALQRALDRYTPGTSNYLSPHLSASDLSRSESRSFGVTHATELEKINTEHLSAQRASQTVGGRLSSIPDRTDSLPVPAPAGSFSRAPPLNPAVLNNEPAPIPEPVGSPPDAPRVVDNVDTSAALSPISPTVAETGLPVSAGDAGPGPSSGSLLELARSRASGSGDSRANLVVPLEAARFSLNDGPVRSGSIGTSSNTNTFPTAEEEKRQLERQERERLLSHPSTYRANPQLSTGSNAALYESAEDEKKRLEREERERLLRGETSSAAHPHALSDEAQAFEDAGPENNEELPPYQDF